MELLAQLIHCEGSHRVVLVTARQGDHILGSALGEAAHAEEAEDRALARLIKRLEPRRQGVRSHEAPAPPQPPPQPPLRSQPPAPSRPRPEVPSQPPAQAPQKGPESPGSPVLPTPEALSPEEPSPEPDDWSGELARLDLELQRLGWGRPQEATYLQRAFGHPSRSRLTVYADLMAFLRVVRDLEPGQDPASAPVPLRRRDLLQQSELLLERLGWGEEQGRRLLQGNLKVSSRQQLDDEQLLRFNMLLESELLGSASAAPPSEPASEPASGPPSGPPAEEAA